MATYEVVLRLLLAVIVGGCIGYERQIKNRPAGLRTHMLVCVGAAIVAIIQSHLTQEMIEMIVKNPELSSLIKADGGRIGSQVISGIGFLGAGTIMHTKGSVKGLTTAATIWAVGCLGVAIGYGYYGLGMISGICVFIVLVSLKRFDNKILRKDYTITLEIYYYDHEEVSELLTVYFKKSNIKVKDIEYNMKEKLNLREQSLGIKNCRYTLGVPQEMPSKAILSSLLRYSDIYKVLII